MSKHSFASLFPFLQPFQTLLEDPSLTGLLVNGAGEVWVERDGKAEPRGGLAFDPEVLLRGLEEAARNAGTLFSERSPLLELALPQGWQVWAAYPDAVVGCVLSLHVQKPPRKRAGRAPEPEKPHARTTATSEPGASTGKRRKRGRRDEKRPPIGQNSLLLCLPQRRHCGSSCYPVRAHQKRRRSTPTGRPNQVQLPVC